MYLQYLIQFASLGLDEDDTLLRVIYERSSTEFSNYIINSEPQKMISSLEEETHITPLTVWNSSLQLIVSSGLINSTSVLTRGTLEKALELGEIEAIEILLQFGARWQSRIGLLFSVYGTSTTISNRHTRSSGAPTFCMHWRNDWHTATPV
jgi:hypothetical protein